MKIDPKYAHNVLGSPRSVTLEDIKTQLSIQFPMMVFNLIESEPGQITLSVRMFVDSNGVVLKQGCRSLSSG